MVQAQALGGVAAHDLVEDLIASAALLLGAVHRRVGLADEVLGGTQGALGKRDADRPRREVLTRRQRVRAPDLVDDAPRDTDRLDRVLDVVADDAELVAAEARDGVAQAHDAAQPRCDRAQQLVAGAVAAAVVDA